MADDDRGSRVDVQARRAARRLRSAAAELGPSARVDLERFERIRRRRVRVERYKVIAIAAAVAIAVALAATRVLPMDRTPAHPVPPATSGIIVFGRSGVGQEQRSLYTIAPDGSSEVRLPVTYTDCGAWSPDGSVLHLTVSEYPGAPLRPAVVAPDGSGFTIVDTGIPSDLNLGCGDWSPDGGRLALEGFGASASIDGIYTVGVGDSSGLARLTHGLDVVPQFSPDGAAIVFQRTAAAGAPHAGSAALFVVGTDGSGLRRITPWGAARSAGSWSQEDRIIFTGPSRSLWTVSPDGTGLERLPTMLPGRPFQPRWSPDGTAIVLGIRTGGQTDIYTLAADGSGLTRLTDTPSADEWWPDWGAR